MRDTQKTLRKMTCAGSTLLSVEFRSARAVRGVEVVKDMEGRMIEALATLSPDEILAFSADEFAEKFNCGQRSVACLFQRYFGISIRGMKLEIRLLKVRSLLRAPGAKVGRVAEELGFNHLGLFNACFEKRFKVSQAEWQNLNGGDAARPEELEDDNLMHLFGGLGCSKPPGKTRPDRRMQAAMGS